MKNSLKVRVVLLVVVLVAGIAIRGVWAQGGSSQVDGSLAGVTAELRQLRLVVQDSSQRQAQLSALSVYVSAQQSRLAQVSQRLDNAHAAVVAASARVREATKMLVEAQAELATAQSVAGRTHLEGMVKMFRQQADQAIADEAEARTRENEFINMFRADEARWVELIGRLEEIVKK